MKVWITLPFSSVEVLRDIAICAESLGADGVAMADHVCVPSEVQSIYPYGSGRPGTIPLETVFVDPFTMIAGLGAVTTTLRFMTDIFILPLRHPVLLAKQVATAAAWAPGRVDVGVGTGWLREEFDVLGIPFEERGRRMDESLLLLRRFWAGQVVEHHGEHFSFDAISLLPTPPEPVRLFIGGQTPPAIRRAARFGDGWTGVNPTLDELREILDQLARARKEAGTFDGPFEIRTGLRHLTRDALLTLADLGVNEFIVTPWQLMPAGSSVFGTASIEGVSERFHELVATVSAH
jgi:probable F420-dependent oxidoreductase